MDATTKGLWIMPTRGRVLSNVVQFFHAAADTGMTTPGALIVDEDDYAANSEAYDALILPDNWSVHVVKGGCCAKATEEAIKDLLTTDMQWFGWLADDLHPETPNWDTRVIAHLNGWNVASTDDGMHRGKKFNGATVWSADVLMAIGYMYPEGFHHFYIDNVVEELHKLTGFWVCDLSIMVRHNHASQTGLADATTDHTFQRWSADEQAFNNWKAKEMIPAADRVLTLMKECGVKMFTPDLSGMSIMIATPCGSGKYERLFMNALMKTVELLKHFGATVLFSDMPYCSDIALARNRLFATFHRSPHTHLLWIDDDMGWNPHCLPRLFMSNRDFVAVAGPRKVFPPSFAVRFSDEQGNPLPIRQDSETGFLEATGIGMAFTIMTRSCVDRLWNAYHDELGYLSSDHHEEVGVFNQMIVNKRYLSEDYALCHRWRMIGGQVWVAAEVPLDHVGAFVWSGSWLASLEEKAAAEQAA